MTHLSQTQLAELKRLRAVATPGEWKNKPRTCGLHVSALPHERVAKMYNLEDAAFICAAANCWDALIAMAEENVEECHD